MSDRGVNAAISRLVWERTELEIEVERLRGELGREALLADEALEENKRLQRIVRDLASENVVRGDCEGDAKCVLCGEYIDCDGHDESCLWRRADEWVRENVRGRGD